MLNFKNICRLIFFLSPSGIGIGINFDSTALEVSGLIYMSISGVILICMWWNVE